MKLFGGKLKLNLLLIPALVLLAVFGQIRALIFYVPVLAVHEWAHVLAAKAMGLCMSDFVIWPFGCSAELSGFAVSRSREIIVAAAGPAVNLVLACAVFIADRYFFEFAAAQELITANVTIAAINLLPALPLDGGHIARAVFASYLGRKRATKVTAVMGIVFSVVLIGLGAAVIVAGEINIGFFVMGLFLCLSAVRELKNAPYELMRDFSGKRDKLYRHKTMSINRIATLYSENVGGIMKDFDTGKYNVVTVLGKDLAALGEVDERTVLEALMQKGPGVTVASLLKNADGCTQRPSMLK